MPFLNPTRFKGLHFRKAYFGVVRSYLDGVNGNKVGGVINVNGVVKVEFTQCITIPFYAHYITYTSGEIQKDERIFIYVLRQMSE